MTLHLVGVEEGEKVPDEGGEGGNGTLDDGHDGGGGWAVRQEQPAREGPIAAPHGCRYQQQSLSPQNLLERPACSMDVS